MVVEKAFGVLKRRFPALRHGLRFKKPEDTCIMIVAALTLHNILIDFKDPVDDFEEFQEENIDVEEPVYFNENLQQDEAHRIRQSIIDNYFS